MAMKPVIETGWTTEEGISSVDALSSPGVVAICLCVPNPPGGGGGGGSGGGGLGFACGNSPSAACNVWTSDPADES